MRLDLPVWTPLLSVKATLENGILGLRSELLMLDDHVTVTTA
jgi:hypothetical protein